MPATSIFAILFGVVAVIGALTAALSPAPAGKTEMTDTRASGIFAALIGVVLFGILTLVSSWTQVSTQNVGVETSFGKTAGDLSDGLHFVPPWDKVTEMDGAIQTTTYAGGNCLNVRIGGQQTACVDITIQWRIRPGSADELFRNYHSFSDVSTALVDRELEQAVNAQLAGYSPIQDLAVNGAIGTTTWTGFAGKIKTQMVAEIGSQIDVLKVIMPYVTYDPATQARLNSLQQQIADTLIADQAIRTAQAQATANNDLAASLSKNPDVLIAQCLNMETAAQKAGYTYQPGFGCSLFSGGSGVGVITGGK